MATENPRGGLAVIRRIVIVDDHDLARAGLRAMISAERDLEVVGEAASGWQAVAVCRQLRPDLVLMDIRMPDLDGLAATRIIKQDCPTTAVILITMHENGGYLLDAIRAGAAGYVLKDASRRELLKNVRDVLNGESVLDPALAGELLRRLAIEPRPDPGGTEKPLSRREREVLQLVARGKTNHQIARQLTVSRTTVKKHLEHIIAKLGASDRTQAAVRAAELGLLSSSFA